ncbi:hypothetical protein [Aliirhizobium smilacinae]|uniref:O-antigen ligase family protein n=1 Tax=Aliirhizobium smilacinae TaxID=1395944 RepID=A0A5C4XMD3_9HYPH|nr:hypothetical protein [Rhizobium smilacinae]TNM63624.1 hypothetical protein FHP24_12550 [Rhizobium smilacinae]
MNHAHNVFLEVALEGGLIEAALVMFYLVVVVQRLSRVSDRLLPRLSFLSICVVLVHSTVD